MGVTHSSDRAARPGMAALTSGSMTEATTCAAMGTEVLPLIVRAGAGRGPVRIWMPGCGTGQDAYVAALCMLARLDQGPDARPLHVLATDVDQAALAVGRRGVYPEHALMQSAPAPTLRFLMPILKLLGVSLPKALCGFPVLYINTALSSFLVRDALLVGA